MKTKNDNEKTCFVIMPISDVEGYSTGHFKRVYEHLIKPACNLAGFRALRADDVYKTNVIIVDILQSILSSDMAICDLSARNPNVLYELGIRQSFNLPVTLLKDSKTQRVFDIQGIRDIEYDDSLRVDIVEQKITEIAETLKNTYEAKDKELKSLIQVLNIKPAEISGEVKISQETSLILEQLKSLNTKINEVDSKVENSSIRDNAIHYISNTRDKKVKPNERIFWIDDLWKYSGDASKDENSADKK